MIQEKEFYRELANVPELPAGLYDAIGREIRRHHAYLRPLLALAAAIIVAIGATTAIIASRPAAGAVSPDLADELLSAREYLNGSDLDQEMLTYTIYEQ